MQESNLLFPIVLSIICSAALIYVYFKNSKALIKRALVFASFAFLDLLTLIFSVAKINTYIEIGLSFNPLDAVIIYLIIITVIKVIILFKYIPPKQDEYLSKYSEPGIIKDPSGNNSFNYNKRSGRSLFVPKIIRSDDIFTHEEEYELLINRTLQVGDKTVFEEINEDGKIDSFVGLKNFVATDWEKDSNKNGFVPIYIFDNHNHAFFFWMLEISKDHLKTPFTLIHVDEHSDMREPEKYFGEYISEEIGEDDEQMENNFLNEIRKPGEVQKMLLDITYDYTNYVLNVGNYIKPAQKFGIIKEIIPVQSETHLDILKNKIKNIKGSVVLNLDMDFFSEGMDYIPYDKKIEMIRFAASSSDLITVSTSPYFMDQEDAIEIIYDIFGV